jgi:hypothetical protein
MWRQAPSPVEAGTARLFLMFIRSQGVIPKPDPFFINFCSVSLCLCGEKGYSAAAGATFQPLTSTTGLAPPRSLER